MIAIIAILAGMLLPALNKSREKARQASCINSHKSISSAQAIYGNDYNDWMVMTVSKNILNFGGSYTAGNAIFGDACRKPIVLWHCGKLNLRKNTIK